MTYTNDASKIFIMSMTCSFKSNHTDLKARFEQNITFSPLYEPEIFLGNRPEGGGVPTIQNRLFGHIEQHTRPKFVT